MTNKQGNSETLKMKSEEKDTKVTEVKSEPSKTQPQEEKKETPKKVNASKAQTMEELLSMTGYTLKGVKKGDVVEGRITRVSSKEILIDIGSKAEGVVIDRELSSYRDMLSTLKVGDDVVCQVIVPENDRGQSVLSLRRHMLDKRWEELVVNQKSGIPVEIIVKEPVRGGVLVDYGGIRGYIPQSQLDSATHKQLEKFIGRKVQAKVVEVDKETNRLIFSQRAVAEAEAFAKQKDVLDTLHEGDTVQATITGVVPFGAFAKITVTKEEKSFDIEGLIHISEIAWEKVEDPTQYVKQGDSVKVKVIGIDMTSGKLTLSLKQLLPDPWEHVRDMFEKDSQVKGAVTRVTPYGVFVKLSPGIEGLIHISKLTAGEEPKAGEEVTCLIEDVQPEKRKISLSLALTEKPIGYR